jgi:hypothetical protein
MIFIVAFDSLSCFQCSVTTLLFRECETVCKHGWGGVLYKNATFVVPESLEFRPRDGGVKSAFKNLSVGIEASYLTYPFGIRLIGGFGNQSDKFGVVDEDTVALGEMLDGGVNVTHGREVEISDVHTDLGAAVGEDTNGFDAVKTAVGGTDIAGYRAGRGDVWTLEVDVVGDKKAASSHGACSGGFVKFGAADVGATGGVTAGGVAKAFELTFANVFEKDTIGTGGGCSVEVDGDAVAAPDEEAGLAGEDGTLGERGSADRDEGDDVGGSDARVDAVLLGEVDEFSGFACSTGGGFDDAGRRAGDSDDGAVVGFIERPVQQANAFDLHRGDDLGDFGCVGAFREVRDAFDDGFRIHWGNSCV